MTHFKSEQFLPATIGKAWDFFSSPVNLNLITPENMRFTIKTELPEKVFTGLLISYRVSSAPLIYFNWTTKITDVNEPFYFIDDQIRGPYKSWRHEHQFREVPGGVMMTDIVTYKIGKSFFGWIAGKLFVHRKVKEIFAYRHAKLKELFPE
jgi:ligand-binding SRPBCC domain-containing protein